MKPDISLKGNRFLFFLAIVALFLFAGASCKKSSSHGPANVQFKGTLSGAAEVPAVSTTATGTVTASYNPGTKVLSYTFTWSNLSSNAAAMHFHHGAPGISGPVIIPVPASSFSAATGGTVSGSSLFPDSLLNELMIGNFYGNIHDSNHPGGEIRAQMVKQ